MNMSFSGTIGATKYKSGEAVLVTPLAVTRKGESLVCSQSIPHTTEETTESGIPEGYCQCGCGQRTTISPVTDRRHGFVRGQPRLFRSGHNKRRRLQKIERAGEIARIYLDPEGHPGLTAIIDAEDIDRVSRFTWRPDFNSVNTYAAASTFRAKSLPLHRYLLDAKPGDIVDHINGDGLDNRRCNLRLVTGVQNCANSRKRSTNTSGYKGVSHDPQRRLPFRAQLHHRGKHVLNARFATAIEAALAFDEAARRLHGEFARVNFPREGEQQA